MSRLAVVGARGRMGRRLVALAPEYGFDGVIAIDAEEGTIDLEVDAAVLAERRKSWRPRETMYASGALWKYAQLVGPARQGAVTHPGAKAEKHVYADI